MLISSKDTFTEAPRIMVDELSGFHGSAKLIHKMTHHVSLDNNTVFKGEPFSHKVEQSECADENFP